VIIFVPGCVRKQQSPKPRMRLKVSVVKEVFAPSEGVAVSYPVLKNLEDHAVEIAINTKLQELFLGDSDSFKEFHEGENNECPSTYKSDFTVEQHNSIIMIHESGIIYEGGAHGSPFHEVYYIDIRNGKFYQFADLLQHKSDLRVVTGLLQGQYKERKEEINGFDDAIDTLEPDQSFVINDGGLEIYFRPYEIAPYSSGFPSFMLSWKEIHDFIDTKSDFYMAYFR